jgi:hypothetical protein
VTPTGEGQGENDLPSPEEAIRLCQTAYYPHRLELLGPSNNFALTQRVTCVGPLGYRRAEDRDSTADSGRGHGEPQKVIPSQAIPGCVCAQTSSETLDSIGDVDVARIEDDIVARCFKFLCALQFGGGPVHRCTL